METESDTGDGASEEKTEQIDQPIPLLEVFKIRGAREVILTFFCYCALEQTAMLWAGSYLVLHNGIPAEEAAGFASILFIGLTVGRMLNGFLTFRLNDTQMIRIGEAILTVGCFVLFLPYGKTVSLVGMVLIGLGCAPIYPCIIHSTPARFGADKSQSLIGVQMASAYVGTCLMPPLFGVLANHINVALLPVYLLVLLALMIVGYEVLEKKTVERG